MRLPGLIVHIDRILCQVDEEGEQAVLDIKLLLGLLKDGAPAVPFHQVSASAATHKCQNSHWENCKEVD